MKKYVAPAITVEKFSLNNVIATSLEYSDKTTNSVQAEERKENPIWD